MVRRDPDKSARNRIIKSIKDELKKLLPDVLKDTGLKNQESLHAKIGSKAGEFIDLKTEVILSDKQYINKWLAALKKEVTEKKGTPCVWIYEQLKNSENFKRYVYLFLTRSYLKHFDELSKNRPNENNSIIWFGQNKANYGLLVTPRFINGNWENDRSEIRSFDQGYWTIGHVLKTGLVIPERDDKQIFNNVEDYLQFFRNVLVRNSGSKYEQEIAQYYSEFVLNEDDQLSIPLMIPEFRYLGLNEQHKYRLDFMIINPYTLSRLGIELSPWSSHGYLAKTAKLTQKEINEMAKDNFSKEMSKIRDYFYKHGVYTLIYPDDKLKDCKSVFNNDIVPYLKPERPNAALSFRVMEEFI